MHHFNQAQHEIARKITSFQSNLSKAYETQTQQVQLKHYLSTINNTNPTQFDKNPYSNKHLTHPRYQASTYQKLQRFKAQLETSYSTNEYKTKLKQRNMEIALTLSASISFVTFEGFTTLLPVKTRVKKTRTDTSTHRDRNCGRVGEKPLRVWQGFPWRLGAITFLFGWPLKRLDFCVISPVHQGFCFSLVFQGFCSFVLARFGDLGLVGRAVRLSGLGLQFEDWAVSNLP